MIPDPFVFLLVALAVYRASNLVTSEEGPFGAFAWIRSKLGGDEQRTWVGRGINCVLCVSFWFGGLGALALLFWTNPLVQLGVTALALSGAVLAFKKWTRA